MKGTASGEQQARNPNFSGLSKDSMFSNIVLRVPRSGIAMKLSGDNVHEGSYTEHGM